MRIGETGAETGKPLWRLMQRTTRMERWSDSDILKKKKEKGFTDGLDIWGMRLRPEKLDGVNYHLPGQGRLQEEWFVVVLEVKGKQEFLSRHF